MLSIRMTRVGSKKKPFFRVVVTEARSKRESSFVENARHLQPAHEAGARSRSTRSAIQHWISKGAQPSDSVRTLLAKHLSRDLSPRLWQPKPPRRLTRLSRSDADGAA